MGCEYLNIKRKNKNNIFDFVKIILFCGVLGLIFEVTGTIFWGVDFSIITIIIFVFLFFSNFQNDIRSIKWIEKKLKRILR